MSGSRMGRSRVGRMSRIDLRMGLAGGEGVFVLSNVVSREGEGEGCCHSSPLFPFLVYVDPFFPTPVYPVGGFEKRIAKRGKVDPLY